MNGFLPDTEYQWNWMDPRDGNFSGWLRLKTDPAGVLMTPKFPQGGKRGGKQGGEQATLDVGGLIRRPQPIGR
jgi:hypothetical protein